nr:ammonia channel protein [Pseudomonadota bacterium]
MTIPTLTRAVGGLVAVVAALLPTLALAQEETPAVNPGDTAWMLTATALVLFMTIPGLSLFYAGMV